MCLKSFHSFQFPVFSEDPSGILNPVEGLSCCEPGRVVNQDKKFCLFFVSAKIFVLFFFSGCSVFAKTKIVPCFYK